MRMWKSPTFAGVLVSALVACASPFAFADAQSSISFPQEQQGSSPDNLVATETHLFFVADDGIHGRELWQLDGDGTVEMVKDIMPGPEGSDIAGMQAAGDRLYFVARYQPHQHPGIFVTQGTRETFRRVHGGFPGLSPVVTSAIGTRYLLVANTLAHGIELWTTDGTEDGTQLLTDILVGPPSSIAEYYVTLLPLPGKRLFAASAPPPGQGGVLWSTDGSPEGTMPVRSSQGDLFSTFSMAALGAPVGEQVMFLIPNDEGPQIWTSDGTYPGTRPVGPSTRPHNQSPTDFAATGQSVYFKYASPEAGEELWCSDGTQEGTRLVADIVPGIRSSSPYSFAPLGAGAVFVADHPEYGTELWYSDGSADGTILLKDLVAGTESSSPYQTTSLGDVVLFSCSQRDTGEELWRTDGTPEGTYPVKDIEPGPKNSEPYYLTPFNGKMYFAATTTAYGPELWESDGTADGTRLAARIKPAQQLVHSSSPSFLTSYDNGLYFIATVDHQPALYRTDGDSHSTRVILADPRFEHVEAMTSTAEGLQLRISANGEESTFMVDVSGGDAGLRLATDERAGAGEDQSRDEVRLGDATFFAGYSPAHGFELWKRDDATGAETLVRDLFPGPSSANPAEFVAASDFFVFRAEDYNKGAELWRSDGSADGTWLMVDFRPTPKGSKPYGMVLSGDLLFFAIEAEEGLRDLFYFNAAPPHQIYNTLTAYQRTLLRPKRLTPVGELLYFTSPHPLYGEELWATSKEWGEARPVADLAPNEAFDAPSGQWVSVP